MEGSTLPPPGGAVLMDATRPKFHRPLRRSHQKGGGAPRLSLPIPPPRSTGGRGVSTVGPNQRRRTPPTPRRLPPAPPHPPGRGHGGEGGAPVADACVGNLFPRLGAEVNSRLAFSTVGGGGALGIQVGGGWVRPISVRFGMGRDQIAGRRRRLRIRGGNRCELYPILFV